MAGASATAGRPTDVTLVHRNHSAGFFSNLNAVVTVLDKCLHRDGVTAVEVDWRAQRPTTQFSYGRPEDGNLWLAFFEPLPFDRFPERRVGHQGFGDLRASGVVAYAMYKMRPSWRRRYGAIYQRHIRPLPRIVDQVVAIASACPDGDADVVLGTLALDPRIGPKAFKGGLGYGGPCLPRDNAALAHLAKTVNAAAPLAIASDAINRLRAGRVLSLLGIPDLEGRRIVVIGLGYKRGTSVVEASQGWEMLHDLLAAGADAIGYDSLAPANTRGRRWWRPAMLL